MKQMSRNPLVGILMRIAVGAMATAPGIALAGLPHPAQAQTTQTTQTSPAESDVSRKVKSIVADVFGVAASNVRNNTSFDIDLGSDDHDRLQFITDLEVAFSIVFSEYQEENMRRVGDAIRFVEEQLAEKAQQKSR